MTILDCSLAATAAAEASAQPHPALFWVGGIITAVLFGGMVWRTLKRNRLK
ncbi:hypothetical protein [Gulosibacter bifidus]|uniref:LPXTG cell wall anchor domain-containing protein n=1 Tax=Gulosibacter bifidus TaxID=272239 RepID=A0ABW5RII0_9MICO|nr:hypothetical protein [Gulosibacter bifidus]